MSKSAPFKPQKPIFVRFYAARDQKAPFISPYEMESFNSDSRAAFKKILKQIKLMGYQPEHVDVRLIITAGVSKTKETATKNEVRKFFQQFKIPHCFFLRESRSYEEIEIHLVDKKITIAQSTPSSTTQPSDGAPQGESSQTNRPIMVMTVDDSKTGRKIVEKCLAEYEDIQICAEAEDPLIAMELLKTHQPDVILLDVHMPKMTGLEFLEKFLPKRPIPTIMISGVAPEDGDTALRCLEVGAFDFIAKPSAQDIPEFRVTLSRVIRAAAKSRVEMHAQGNGDTTPRLINTHSLQKNKMILIGSSTGGTVALTEIFKRLPASIPPIVIVQHIPEHFSNLFAKRLNSMCPFEIKEAEHGDIIQQNRVLIAPGHSHLKIAPVTSKDGSESLCVQLTQEEPELNHRPSVNVMFRSMPHKHAKNAIGVILTGMGKDGAEGLKHLKQLGAQTIGQNQISCAVYGMPKAAKELGAVDTEVSLEDLPAAMIAAVSEKKNPS
ncbi:MAG: chemotaxis response regulator protein-glutamate methylesterase [Zetaproteobacteria bacterium]|nr:chemotaxis response regulator protein-glutamate methylesterase [Zetaproteobacteria bacterium]